MSTSTSNPKSFSNGKIHYFELHDSKDWSVDHFNSWTAATFGQEEVNEAIFYKILQIIKDDSSTSRKVKNVIKNLMDKKTQSTENNENQSESEHNKAGSDNNPFSRDNSPPADAYNSPPVDAYNSPPADDSETNRLEKAFG
ncbi:13545_t:CDS:2, partial [Racocetra fulgida]